MRIAKKQIGDTVRIVWQDPQTKCRVDIKEMQFAEEEIVGKIVVAGKDHVIIQHARCDDLGDYTIIHPTLIKELKKIG